MEAPEPRGTEAQARASARLAWATISSVPRPFGGPPPPLLAFLQPEPLPAALQTAREPKVRELTRLMVTDSVKENFKQEFEGELLRVVDAFIE
jgi:hypothetical protein